MPLRCPLSSFGYAAGKISTPLRRLASSLCRALRRDVAENILSPLNRHDELKSHLFLVYFFV